MPIRDFTDATKSRLLKQIKQVTSKGGWGWLTDKLGDGVLYLGKWTHILSLKDDMSNVKSYHKHVLDMTNMSAKKLESIFSNVEKIDANQAKRFNTLEERQREYNSKIKDLTALIQPNFKIISAKEIKKAMETHNKNISNYDEKITKEYNLMLSKAETRARLKAVKSFLGGTLKTAADLFLTPVKIVKDAATGNFVGLAFDAWDLCNDVFMIGSGAVAVTVSLISFGLSNKASRTDALESVQAYSGVEGLADVMEAEEKLNGKDWSTTGIKKVAQTIDTADTAYNIFDTSKSFLKDPKKMIDPKFGFKTGNSELDLKIPKTFSEYKKYQKYQKIYQDVQNTNHYVEISNLKKGYEYVESIFSFTDGESPFEQGAKKGMENGIPAFKQGEKAINIFTEDVPKLFE